MAAFDSKIQNRPPSDSYLPRFFIQRFTPHFPFIIYILTIKTMSSFGTLYRVHTYGESHCKSVGCIVDGVPPVSFSANCQSTGY